MSYPDRCEPTINNNLYDLRGLRAMNGKDYFAKDGALTFRLNLCGNTFEPSCNNLQGNLCKYEHSDASSMLSSWNRDPQFTWKSLPDAVGLSLSFKNGPKCDTDNTKNISVDISLVCADSYSDSFAIHQISNCDYSFNLSTPYVCSPAQCTPTNIFLALQRNTDGLLTMLLSYLPGACLLVYLMYISIAKLKSRSSLSVFQVSMFAFCLTRIFCTFLWLNSACSYIDCYINRLAWCLYCTGLTGIIQPWMKLVALGSEGKGIFSGRFANYIDKLLLVLNILFYLAVSITLMDGCESNGAEFATACFYLLLSFFFAYCICSMKLTGSDTRALRIQLNLTGILLIFCFSLKISMFIYTKISGIILPQSLFNMLFYIIPENLPLFLQGYTEFRRLGGVLQKGKLDKLGLDLQQSVGFELLNNDAAGNGGDASWDEVSRLSSISGSEAIAWDPPARLGGEHLLSSVRSVDSYVPPRGLNTVN